MIGSLVQWSPKVMRFSSVLNLVMGLLICAGLIHNVPQQVLSKSCNPEEMLTYVLQYYKWLHGVFHGLITGTGNSRKSLAFQVVMGLRVATAIPAILVFLMSMVMPFYRRLAAMSALVMAEASSNGSTRPSKTFSKENRLNFLSRHMRTARLSSKVPRNIFQLVFA
jgi:hypothetical protein